MRSHSMIKISKDEYKKQLSEFSLAEWDKIKGTSQQPNGMFGTWGWHIRTEKKFKEKLKSLNIEVEK